MADELSQLDEIIESDMLDALGEKSPEQETPNEEDEITIEDFVEDSADVAEAEEDLDIPLIEDFEEETPKIEEEAPTIPEEEISTQTATIETDSSSIATLLAELLKNKTLEITIKIKE